RLHEQKQDVNEILLDLLKQRNQRTEEKIQETHERLSGETHPPVTRYKSKEIQNLLKEKYGKKCAIHGCTKPAEEIHHKIRFGLQANNDPAFMVPLCAEHHKIAHAIDLIVVRKWRSGSRPQKPRGKFAFRQFLKLKIAGFFLNLK
ncbi:MAG: HNH endonuclease signature motif containing protein, partial [Candidatus Gracilibacteria bacterium]